MSAGPRMIENHSLPRAQDVVEDPTRVEPPRSPPRPKLHEYRVTARPGLRLDPHSAPRGKISKPRPAPACSMAVRISTSISLSRTISPETACDSLITVPRSSCSTGAPTVTVPEGNVCSRAGQENVVRAAAPCRWRPSGRTVAHSSSRHSPSFRSRDQAESGGQFVSDGFVLHEAVARAKRTACSYSRSASSSRPSMRAISAPRSEARFSKFSGQFAAQTWSCARCAARASRCSTAPRLLPDRQSAAG